jgi:hypothetical protein
MALGFILFFPTCSFRNILIKRKQHQTDLLGKAGANLKDSDNYTGQL